jgi:hypothetical protein
MLNKVQFIQLAAAWKKKSVLLKEKARAVFYV